MKLNQKNIALFFYLACSFWVLGVSVNAQSIKSVEAFSNYSVALNRYGSTKQYINAGMKISDANGMGGGVKVNFSVYKNYYVGLSIAYQLYSVHQDSAINKWNWLFWDTRYKGNVQDALSSDPTLSGILNPIQKIDVVPIFITFNAEYTIAHNLFVSPSVGVGMASYTRRLYLEETWQKKFDDLNYTFGYSYRNFAPNKTGNPFGISAGLNIAYEFLDGFRLHSEAGYVQFIKTPGSSGSDAFPLERIINVNLGLTILY